MENIQRSKSITHQELEQAYEQSRLAGMPGKKSMVAEVSVLLGSGEGRTLTGSRASMNMSTSPSSPSSTTSPSALLGSSSTSPRSGDTPMQRTFSEDLVRPASMEAAQAVMASDASAMYGWYQPLHIVSQASESSSQQPLVPVVLAPAEQELLSGAGAVPGYGADFFDFSWDAPEGGERRSYGSARPDRGSSAASGADAGRFFWSSDEMRRVAEGASGQGWDSGQDQGMSDTINETSNIFPSSQAGLTEGSASAVPVAMETNLLRSAVSDEDVIARQTRALQSTSDVDLVKEAVESQENRQDELQDVGKEGELFEMVPVVASASEDRDRVQSATSSGSETPQASAAPVETNPETGVVEAVAPAPRPLPPAPQTATSPPLAELIDDQKLQADKEGERMDKEMRDFELTSVELYPESRLVILLALLCIIWILFLILTAAVRHGIRPGGETTTKAGGGSDHEHTAEYTTGGEEPPPDHRPTGPIPRPPPVGPVGPAGPAGPPGITEEPLRDVFYCSTEYCKREGDHLRGLTSQSSKRACDDFYEHVCEAWKKYATPLLDKQPGAAVSTDTLLQRAMEERLLAYIKDPAHTDVAPARTMYERCTDRADADAALLNVKELFRSWGSEWPQANNTGGTSDDVWRFAGKLLRVLGVPSIVGVEIGLEPQDLSKTIVEVGPPKGAIFYSKDVSDHRVMALFTDATRSAALALNPRDAASASAAAADVSVALATLSLLHLDDLGTSPLDFEVENFGALSKGVQAFMRVVFERVTVLNPSTRIMLHRGRLIRREIESTLNSAPPRAMLNYLGLLALVSLSPFLPEQFAQLRVLHSVYTLGRAEAPTTEQLCFRTTVQAYPACVFKASREVHKDVRRYVWLSQLESLFVDYVHDVAWMDNLTSLFVRYKMRHHHFERFFPTRTLGDCKPVPTLGTPKTMAAFVETVALRQTQLLSQYGKSLLPVGLGSPLSVWARYRLCLQLLQIPVGLVNSSVPTNGTFFALHLSRFAVRLYAGLSQLLYEGTVYELEIPLYFTEDAERMLDEALDCLLCDARRRFPHGLDADRVRNALLEQVLALQLGFKAFRNLMGVRRIWHRDFQLSTFPNVTADQLFFLYYALDNCELSDAVFESHQFEAHRRLPASVRVNMALRQFMHFAHSFGCAAGSPMAAGVPCRLLR
ncbi:hypothetical protein HPB50_022521 [Hyalomma asiaticum]|uniref:Uncharacterized protein n=1 Tax=Hyalomma asiaticum TaxID=266040 RepID=A0ACB7S526_HYAAI|nr:hypothetical protein HPB50_022521 [Hyalomma asiaticum]